MSISTLNDFAGYDRNSSRKALPQNIIGGGALACIVLVCGWTVWTNVFDAANPSVNAVVTTAPKAPQNLAGNGSSVGQSSGFNARFSGTDAVAIQTSKLRAPALKRMAAAESTIVESAAFSARFDAVRSAAPLRRTAVAAPSAIRKNYVALLDPSYSLGPAPGKFSALAPANSDRRLAMTAPAQDDVKLPPEVLPPPAAVAELEAVPLPMRRPSSLRVLADREMAKAKAAVLAVTEPEKPTIFERLFGKAPSAGPRFAYASADLGDVNATGSLGRVNASGVAALYDRSTAVYDISAHTVYLPDGTKLEAHSGLGNRLDDPDAVRERMRGPTPPHLYDLSMRESLFHGVQALRLTPVDGEQAIYGRTGLLAHTYMLGPNGDSNGCVSFRNYEAFLRAYNQGIKRLAVVARLD